jgi:multicomponent Na+:H+ antiporter subunit F
MRLLFLFSCAAILVLCAPYFLRVVAGPTAFDRIVALNGIGTKVAVLLVLVGLLYDRAPMFIDLALGLFLLNLVTTLLVARYVREKGGL